MEPTDRKQVLLDKNWHICVQPRLIALDFAQVYIKVTL